MTTTILVICGIVAGIMIGVGAFALWLAFSWPRH